MTLSIAAINLQPVNCGGLYRPDFRGTGTISGTAKLDTVASASRITLFTAASMRIGFRHTDATGVYSFLGLPAGDYLLLVEDDRQWFRRPKVELVTI